MPDTLIRQALAPVAAALVVVLAAGPAPAWDIVPHRAMYALDLASARAGSSISDVDGRMMFQWGESCDGWTVEQRYRLNFLYIEGPEVELSSVYATWESKDGREFSFNMRSATNGVVDEELRGQARLTRANNGGGSVNFRLPDEAQEALPTGTLFPTAHTLALLDQAAAGTRLFNAILFDGTTREGLTEINAVIGDQEPAAGEAAEPLLDRPSWPVTMAFFSLAEEVAEPDYEMFVQLHDNGVVDRMRIDYGDFAVEARLTNIEPLAAPNCR